MHSSHRVIGAFDAAAASLHSHRDKHERMHPQAGRFMMSIDSETDHALNPVMVTLGDTVEEDENGIQRWDGVLGA